MIQTDRQTDRQTETETETDKFKHSKFRVDRGGQTEIREIERGPDSDRL